MRNNVPITKQEMKLLPIGYTPTLYPNRRTRREQIRKMFNKKGKRVQIVTFLIDKDSYMYRDRDEVYTTKTTTTEDTGMLFVRRKLYHDK